MEMHFHESQGSCVWRSRRRDLELWSDSDLLNIYFVFNKYLSHICKKKNYNNKIKTTFGPPLLPIKHPHKTPPLTNLRGVRTPPPLHSGSVHALFCFYWEMKGQWATFKPVLWSAAIKYYSFGDISAIYFQRKYTHSRYSVSGFESATFWLQVTYMLDIQRNWQSKLSNVPLSINWVYIILIILFKKNFTTKNGIWLNLSAIYLHCTLCEESCTGILEFRPPAGHPYHGRVRFFYRVR